MARLCQSAQKAKKSPPRPEPGGLGVQAESGVSSYGRPTPLVDPVASLTSFGLEGLDRVPGLLHRTGHDPDGVTLPAHGPHELGNGGAPLALQRGHHPAVLLPSRGLRCPSPWRLSWPWARSWGRPRPWRTMRHVWPSVFTPRGLVRLRLGRRGGRARHRLAESLDARPDSANRRL